MDLDQDFNMMDTEGDTDLLQYIAEFEENPLNLSDETNRLLQNESYNEGIVDDIINNCSREPQEKLKQEPTDYAQEMKSTKLFVRDSSSTHWVYKQTTIR